MAIKGALRAMLHAQEHLLPKKEVYDPRVCQCCGHYRKHDEDPECVCDGLRWFLKDGVVECEAHRFARAVGEAKTQFVVRKS